MAREEKKKANDRRMSKSRRSSQDCVAAKTLPRGSLSTVMVGQLPSRNQPNLDASQTHGKKAGRRRSLTELHDAIKVQKATNITTVRYMLESVMDMSDPIVVSYLTDLMTSSATFGRPVVKQAFEDVVINYVTRELKVSGGNLRVLFKHFDAYSYGQLLKEQLAEMVSAFCSTPMPVAVTDFLFDSIDTKRAERIDYDQLFNRLFRSTNGEKGSGASWTTDGDRTIRSVVVITRHGARFPLKSFPKNAHWPQHKRFWETYGGKLTPVGAEQHIRLGKRLREKYIRSEQLLEELSPDLPSRIHAYTSNQDRTLMSAQSLLLGMFPGASVSFLVDEDVSGAKIATIKRLSSSSLSICMSMSDYTPLLHGFKENPVFEKMKKQAIADGRFGDWAKDETYSGVIAKLWTMTGFQKINPSKNTMTESLSHMQSVAQQLDIERAHQMELLLNNTGLQLTLQDEEVVTEVAEYICRLRYGGHSDEQQREMARHASGLLPAAIVHGFEALVRGQNEEGQFTLYSAHDNTIMALLAHLGFKNYPIPKFAAHVVFELHEIDGVPRVKVLYNPDPEFNGFSSEKFCTEGLLTACDYLELPVDEIVDYDYHGVSQDGMPLADFSDLLMNKRRSFHTPEEWEDAAYAGGEYQKEEGTKEEKKKRKQEEESKRKKKKKEASVDSNSIPEDAEDEQSSLPSPAIELRREPRWSVSPDAPSSTAESDDRRRSDPRSSDTSRRSSFRRSSCGRRASMLGNQFREHITQARTESTSELGNLTPFTQQVAGHPLTFLELGSSMIAKPMPSDCVLERALYIRVFPGASLNNLGVRPSVQYEPIMTLAPFVPEYHGDIFVSAETTKVGEDDEGTDIVTRPYKLTVPQKYASMSLSNKELLPASKTNPPEVSPRYSSADTYGWVRKRALSTHSWVRRWMILHNGVLYWYKNQTPFGGTEPLGCFKVRKYCKAILLSTDQRLKSVAWPKVSGVGVAMMTHDNNTHGLHFETFNDSYSWINAFRKCLALHGADLDPTLDEDEMLNLAMATSATPSLEDSPSFGQHGSALMGKADKGSATKPNSMDNNMDTQEQGQIFLVLENLLSPFERPCVLDLKLGTRQHADNADPEKKRKAIKKCAQTTSKDLGLRCCGMRVYFLEECRKWDKAYGKLLTAENFNEAIESFFDNGSGIRVDAMAAIEEKLAEFRSVLNGIDGFRFYSSSLLLIYDGDESNPRVDVRMIDFARATIPSAPRGPAGRGDEGPDVGALFGVDNLLERMKQVRSAAEEELAAQDDAGIVVERRPASAGARGPPKLQPPNRKSRRSSEDGTKPKRRLPPRPGLNSGSLELPSASQVSHSNSGLVGTRPAPAASPHGSFSSRSGLGAENMSQNVVMFGGGGGDRGSGMLDKQQPDIASTELVPHLQFKEQPDDTLPANSDTAVSFDTIEIPPVTPLSTHGMRARRQRAADQKCAKGQLNLGIMYDPGKGVAQNNEEAAKLYRLSAD